MTRDGSAGGHLAAGNKEFGQIIVRANAGEAIAPAERILLDMRSEAVLRWENVHYQHRAGMYDESEFSKHSRRCAK